MIFIFTSYFIWQRKRWMCHFKVTQLLDIMIFFLSNNFCKKNKHAKTPSNIASFCDHQMTPTSRTLFCEWFLSLCHQWDLSLSLLMELIQPAKDFSNHLRKLSYIARVKSRFNLNSLSLFYTWGVEAMTLVVIKFGFFFSTKNLIWYPLNNLLPRESDCFKFPLKESQVWKTVSSTDWFSNLQYEWYFHLMVCKMGK